MQSASFTALGTTVLVQVDDPDVGPGQSLGEAISLATSVVAAETDAFDATCSRFRDDSELVQLGTDGRAAAVSELLYEAIAAAQRAADITGGLVDPTVGGLLEELGYDRDFQFVSRAHPATVVRVSPAPGWSTIQLDPTTRSVTVPRRVRLDLGATAKALCADRAARAATSATGRGVLVSLGGDVALAGEPPDDGWTIQLGDNHTEPIDHLQPAVSLRNGGLATSGTAARRWSRGNRAMHHIVDPATGWPADEVWRTATVAAATCVDANIGSTAAIILGAAAPAWLEDHGLPARLVAVDGTTVTIGSWPRDTLAPIGGARQP